MNIKMLKLALMLVILLAFHLNNISVFSQVPEKMSYQAVIRNDKGALVINQQVGIRIQIKQGSEFGAAVYVETHNPETNNNGLVSLEIGGGEVIVGIFSFIDWSSGPYFLQTEIDLKGGTNYIISSVSQLLSVPYALHAKSLENGFSGSYKDLTELPDFTRWDKDSTDNVTTTGNQTIAGNKKFTGTISAGDKAITNVAAPVNNTDAANKAYVDALNAQLIILKNTVYAGGSLIDIDGNVYNTVKIGTQIWMAENLKVTHYQNGDSLPEILGNLTWCNNRTGAYCEYPVPHNMQNPYGYIYNFYAVEDSRKLCPSGWHVPSRAEWVELTEYLGGETVAGGKLKEVGIAYWDSPNTGATNETGFKALGGGRRDCEFIYMGRISDWWSSTQYDNLNGQITTISSAAGNVYWNNGMKQGGAYVRCVKD